MDPFTIGIIVAVVVALGWLLMTYNGLVSLRNRVKEAWSQIDVQLKRRYDLIPNLVNSVKGYMKHEKGIIKEVTDARKALLLSAKIANSLLHNLKQNKYDLDRYSLLPPSNMFIYKRDCFYKGFGE